MGDAAVGKAIGDTTKGLLETDADKIRQQGAAAFDTGNWEDLDYFGMGGWIGSGVGKGMAKGAIALAALAGMPELAPIIGSIVGISIGGLMSLIIGGNLLLKEWMLSPMAAGAVEKTFDDLKSSIEKAKTEQEAKKKDSKEVSAAAMDYFSYILGYK